MNPNQILLAFFANKQNESFKRFVQNELIRRNNLITVAGYIENRNNYINRIGAIGNNALLLEELIKKRFKLDINQMNYDLVTPYVSIPYNYNDEENILNNIYACLKDLIYIYTEIGAENDFENCEVIKRYYGIGTTLQNQENISKDINVTAQAISHKLFDQIGMKKLFNGETVNHIIVNNFLVERCKNVISESMYNNKFRELICKDTDCENEKLKRIAELFNLGLIEEDRQGYLVKQTEVRSFRDHYRAIGQTINQIVFTITKEQLSKLVEEELNKEFEFNNIFFESLIKQHQCLEVIETENEIKYQYKWEYLSNNTLKLQRILVDEYRQMKRQEIIDEYNYRANSLGLINLNGFPLTQDENFKLCGGNGNWVYAKVYENSDINPDQSLTEFLEQFLISQDGKATYSKILEAVKEIGIFIHAEGSIRTTLFNIASLSSNNDDLFIHSDYETQYPDIKLFPNKQLHLGHKFILKLIEILKYAPLNKVSSKSLLPEIIKRLNDDGVTISNGNCSQYLRLFLDDEESIIREIIENGQRFIILDIEKLANCNLDRIGKQKEKEHITTIRSSAINYLKTIEGGKSQKIDILESIKVKGEYPAHLKSDSIFYKILSDKSIFETITFDGISYVQLRADKQIVKKPFSEEIENEIIEKEIIVDSTNQPQIQQQYIQRLPYNWEQIRSSFTTELYYYRLDDSILTQGANSLYKALHIDNQIDFWGNQFLQTISNLWFYQTDKYDRHIYLRTMANDYETFLKRFELATTNTTGLSTVIESIPVLKDLRNYDETCSISRVVNYDRTKRSFSIILNKLIGLRNKSTHNASHPIFDMGMSSQTKTIADFIALYVYTAYILNR
ncbi:MAG: hypothetical protein WCK78_12255 [Paludibacter sp.]